jgi:integrase
VHNLETYLDAYINAGGLAQADVYRMIRRRAMKAGIRTLIGNHTFRATGITQYLRNDGGELLEMAQESTN